ncbi:HIV-1 Vpr-binding protein [Strigomonas culicis]|uniref:HIV-1 Vpr-binding protein n=1 Tax=Strigomonas culicis TaxID=28005 RepID=S9U262_9TRYP|nr:HIV-1 Vpr-binding protein [Strigomonas culicis]|eukprot:EPY23033.1 HIV-1 Vpr-binding protein [Strigomonas culicis]
MFTATHSISGSNSFESLANSLHSNTAFCEGLNTLIETSTDGRPYPDEPLNDAQREVLKEYYKEMEKIQLTASCLGYLIVEGAKEYYGDPLPMYDVCTNVLNEQDRRKRLISLSLMYHMIDQDELASSEAFAQEIPRALMHQLRHLVHAIFGHFPRSKLNGYTRAQRDPVATTSRSPRQNTPIPSDASRYPPAPVVDTATPPEHHTAGEGTPRKRIRSRGRSPVLLKYTRQEGNGEGSFVLDTWTPQPGEKVGRGPCWGAAAQGKQCDFGEVVGITEQDEVVVKWVPSCDVSADHESEKGRLFCYKYKSPNFEVCSWESYLATMTEKIDSDTLRLLEFMQVCAVCGILCSEKDVVAPSLQFQSIEGLLYVLDSINLSESQDLLDSTVESAELREKRRYEGNYGTEEIQDGEDEGRILSILQWDTTLQRRRRTFRQNREMVVRVLWALNALLNQKKLALLFLGLDGVARVFRIINGPSIASCMYGCTMVLSNLAKSAIFEELLREHRHYFMPIMTFMINQWRKSPSIDIQECAGLFLFHTLSFPCVITYFDQIDGASEMLEMFDKIVKKSEEVFDVVDAGIQRALLKCLNIYVVYHLMLSTRAIFREHRTLSVAITKLSPDSPLPRDPAIASAVLGFLAVSPSQLPNVPTETIRSLLKLENLFGIHKLIEKGFHSLLLKAANYYFIQSRSELLVYTLQALSVLTVIPAVRPLIAEPRSHDSGVAQLLLIICDFTSTIAKGAFPKEGFTLPCITVALQILINVTAPPYDTSDEATVSEFNHACGIFRGCEGIRILIDVLNVQTGPSLSAKMAYFPIVARAIQLLVTLRRYGDTEQLFDALKVHRIAQTLLQHYSDVQREYMTVMGQRKLLSELDPTGRFVDNVKVFLPGTDGNPVDIVKLNNRDPLEIEQRKHILGRAIIDYSQNSLMRLIAEHLEKEGLRQSAAALRSEAGVPPPPSPAASRIGEGKVSAAAEGTSLDALVRSYLRQQQEPCTNIIETLPQFDLTKKHVYIPISSPPDDTRNILDRLLWRKTGIEKPVKMQMNDVMYSYRYPSFLFDITGGGDGIQGESVLFCDHGDSVMIGTSEGAVALFDTFPDEASEEKQLEQHLVFENEPISSLSISKDGSLIAAINESNRAVVMSRSALPIAVQEFSGCSALRFSHDSKWSLLTHDEERVCSLFDLETKKELCTFTDSVWSGESTENVAIFNSTSSLILSDAVLWDVRCKDKPVFRFDRVTESLASMFHPHRPLVIIDEVVWDLRRWGIVQTIPAFLKTSNFHTSRAAKVIYSFKSSGAVSEGSLPVITAIDSYSLETIFSEDVRPPFKAFAVDPSDRFCAAILDENDESVIRLFTTSAGPFADIPAFASPGNQERSGSAMEEEEEPNFSDEFGDDYGDDDNYDGDEASLSSEEEDEEGVSSSHPSETETGSFEEEEDQSDGSSGTDTEGTYSGSDDDGSTSRSLSSASST